MEEFISGQRWISHAELQLGLGTIIDTAHRTVTISFMASDETRTYARQNAPLTRVIYTAGESVNSIDGDSIEVISVSDSDGIVTYNGVNTAGETVTLKEDKLDHFIQLNRPAERLFSGQIDRDRWFNLRYQTLKNTNRQMHSELSGLTGCRTSLIAHQLYIAHEVANRYAPRVLLADEVGLGKTIEAGLILHHQLLNERAQRVLIVVPESLIHQWLVEMLRRFNLMFSIFDEQRCQAMNVESAQSSDATSETSAYTDSYSENAFLSEQLVLCSLEFLAKNETYYQDALQGEWDLLVVDEAHHLQWTPQQSSHEYRLIEQLAQQIRGILLLTATPEQLGIESHFARLRLLDPARFPDLQSFIAEEQGYQPIAKAMDALVSNKNSEQTLDPETKDILKEFLNEAGNTSNTSKQELIEHMLDRHGTGRVLFRNTRTAVKGFPGRQVIAHPQILPDEYAKSLQQFSQSFLAQEREQESFSNLILFPELLYQIEANNLTQAQDWTQLDPRVNWLGDWLIELRHTSQDNSSPVHQNKTLVITANASTAIDLANTLKTQFGIYAAVFHEGLSLIERDRAAAFFADSENGAPVLICSEIGSEGRNFQFAHQMVLFDLPLNPDLLEQRIGRLDRIGQTQTIQIHVPYLKNSAQEILFHWYHEGLNAFAQTCPAGHNVFAQVQTQLKNELMLAAVNETVFPDDTDLIQHPLIQKTGTLHQKLNSALHNGRDRLLEYNSCRQPEADQLKSLAEKEHQSTTLRHYMEALFNALGIEHSDHSEHCYIIAPGEHMIHQFPGLPDDGLTLTYDRSIALANEDMQFFTWEHPMVRTAMDMINSSEMGNTAITTLDSADLQKSYLQRSGQQITLKPGTLLLECLFVLETSAHEILQADRYLPPTTIRIVLDEKGQDLSKAIRHSDIIATEKIKKQIAQQIIKAKDEALQQMISRAESHCREQTPAILKTAREASQQTLLNEINRLKALAQVNPNIREEEVEFYAQQLQSLDTIFNSVKPRLDALRVIIAT